MESTSVLIFFWWLELTALDVIGYIKPVLYGLDCIGNQYVLKHIDVGWYLKLWPIVYLFNNNGHGYKFDLPADWWGKHHYTTANDASLLTFCYHSFLFPMERARFKIWYWYWLIINGFKIDKIGYTPYRHFWNDYTVCRASVTWYSICDINRYWPIFKTLRGNDYHSF